MSKKEEAEQLYKHDDPDVESDEGEVDADGYDTKDPYADMAKNIDRQREAIEARKELREMRINKVSDAVLKNQSSITKFEKQAKNVIAIAGLAFLVFSGYQTMKEEGKDLDAVKSYFDFRDLFSLAVFNDASQELVILVGSLTFFAITRGYNNYLDRLDEEAA